MRVTSSSFSIALVSVAVACASNSGPTAVGAAVISTEWVTGAAAAALGPDGRFVFPRPTGGGPFAISESDAREQAVAWARLVATMPTSGGTDWFAPGGSGLERDHGAKIPFADLRDCGRAIYAESAYGPIPSGVPRYLLNGFGPYWLIHLCSPAGDAPVVLAEAVTSGLVVRDGRLQPATSEGIGNEFRSAAVPRDTPPFRALPLEPEAAVAFAYRKTGRRVSELPVFVQRVADYGRPDPFAAQFGFWRLTLDSPVNGTGALTRSEYDTRDVAVCWPGCTGNDTTLLVALSSQPDTVLRVPYTVPAGTAGGQPTRVFVDLPVRPPYRFETLRLSGR